MDGYYGYGVVSPLPIHMVASSASWMVHGSHLPWPLITSAFAVICALFYRALWQRTSRGQLVAGAAATLSLLLLYSEGYSPQYLTWWLLCSCCFFLTARVRSTWQPWGAINLVELPIYFSFFGPALAAGGARPLPHRSADDPGRGFPDAALTPVPVRVLAARAKSQQQHGW